MALNEVSGTYLTVFSIHSKEKRRVRAGTSFSSGDYMQMMTGISSYKNPSVSTSNLIGRYFGDTVSVSYPALLFFQVNEEQITDALLISLKATLIEDSFLELKKYISAASEALKMIEEENKSNYKEIFDQLELSVNKIKQIASIRKWFNEGKSLLGLLKLLKIY
ncbi:hypothetical protein [Mucilaginibacter koreensis]